MVERYAAGEGGEEGGEPKSFVSLNWVLTEEPLDLETELVRPPAACLPVPCPSAACCWGLGAGGFCGRLQSA